MELKEKIKALAKAQAAEIVAIRHHLHQNPELSFEEVKTCAYISDTLTRWGIAHEKGVCGTGIVGVIEGKRPEGRVIALRADIDALPITEVSNKSYCSQNKGVMHACGHDVHSASLLGSLRILQLSQESWDGKIKFIFQPGEEKLPGGASLMIAEGVLENPKVSGILGQHVFPELAAGKVGFRAGTYMASADEIYITVTGKGGHAAMPQQNIDPIVVAAEIIGALQKIVSRNAPPAIPTVLSFGKIIGDGATNVIPDKVFLEGTLRTFDEKWRFDAHDKIRRICQGIAEAHGAGCETDIRVGYPFLNNNDQLTELARTAAIAYLGATQVVELPLRMTAEDFAFYAQESAGCFYRLGTASADGSNSYGVHNARFDIDEQALEVGSGLMAFLAIQSLMSN